MSIRIWTAHFNECYRGCCDEAFVLIRAEDEDKASEIAKQWEAGLNIKLVSVVEFTSESEMVTAHYA